MPLDGGYTISEDNFVYIKPTKDMDISKLKIPKCRGIVIESGFEAVNKIDDNNNFRNHIECKEQSQTSFKFAYVG